MIAPEEEARANLYGLLARLFYGSPDPGLLRAIAADTLEGDLAEPWDEVRRAAAAADPEALREEYETAFIGTGKAPVTLYTSAYSIRFSNEVPLAELRGELLRLGLARRAEAREPEDHIAALCDVMRHLIAKRQDLDEQRRFFHRWIAPAAEPLCAAIERSELGSFHRAIGRLAKTFFSLEQAAFEML